MKKAFEYLLIFSLGATIYTVIELIWRGYSHWTMALTGGLCFSFIYSGECKFYKEPRWKRCVAGSLFISLCELIVGFFVNIVFLWNVWDYSDMPFNIFGQICPLYSIFWFLLCFAAGYICIPLKKLFGIKAD